MTARASLVRTRSDLAMHRRAPRCDVTTALATSNKMIRHHEPGVVAAERDKATRTKVRLHRNRVRQPWSKAVLVSPRLARPQLGNNGGVSTLACNTYVPMGLSPTIFVPTCARSVSTPLPLCRLNIGINRVAHHGNMIDVD